LAPGLHPNTLTLAKEATVSNAKEVGGQAFPIHLDDEWLLPYPFLTTIHDHHPISIDVIQAMQ
jgi:hypothetical protein